MESIQAESELLTQAQQLIQILIITQIQRSTLQIMYCMDVRLVLQSVNLVHFEMTQLR